MKIADIHDMAKEPPEGKENRRLTISILNDAKGRISVFAKMWHIYKSLNCALESMPAISSGHTDD